MYNDFNEAVSAYIKAMTDTKVPGAWHWQQFGLDPEGNGGVPYYVVALFDEDNQLVEDLGADESFHDSLMQAQANVDNGDYPFSWEELSESTARHTAAWEELDPVEECDCPPECKATMDGLW